MTSVHEDAEPVIAAPAVPAAAPDAQKSAPRRWPLATGALLVTVITVTAVVHGIGGKGALITAGIIAAVVMAAVILWRLPHLRKHFARPKGMSRPHQRGIFGTGRQRHGSSGSGHRGRLFPGLGRGSRSRSRTATGTGPAAGQRRGLRGRLPSWVPGSARRAERRQARSAAGRGAGKSAGGKDSPPASRARRAFDRVTGRTARAKRKAAAAGTKGTSAGTGAKSGSSEKRGGSARKGGSTAKPAKGDTSPERKALGKRKGKFRRKPKCKRCGKPATGEVTWADGTNGGTELLCDDCWDKGTAKAQEAAGKPPADPERQPGSAIEPDAPDTAKRKKKKLPKETSKVSTEAVAEAVQEHIGSFEPENGADFDQFLAGLPGVYHAMGDALTRLADRFGEEFPVHPAVHEHIREMAATTAGLSEFADEAYRIHRTAHEKEMERIEEPRANEQMWDVNQ